MSVTNSKLVKTTKKVTTRSKQQFIRLNLDIALEKMLEEYEQKYTLLNRSDIIRMLLSEIYYQNKQKNKTEFLSFISSLPKVEKKLTENEIFELVYQD